MKKILGNILLVVVLCFLCASQAAAKEQKIAFIDLSKVFDEYQKTKDLETILDSEAKKSQDKRKNFVKEVKRFKDELELLSEKGRKEREQIIDKKIQGLKDFDKEIKTALGKKRDNMVREILKDIDKVVQEIGKKEGYDLILNDRVLLYSNERLDLSDKIIKILDVKYTEKKGK